MKTHNANDGQYNVFIMHYAQFPNDDNTITRTYSTQLRARRLIVLFHKIQPAFMINASYAEN